MTLFFENINLFNQGSRMKQTGLAIPGFAVCTKVYRAENGGGDNAGLNKAMEDNGLCPRAQRIVRFHSQNSIV